MTLLDEVKRIFVGHHHIYMYGAGVVAHNVYTYLKQHHLQMNIEGIIVSELADNPLFFDNYLINSFDQLDKKKDLYILIAVSKNKQQEIVSYLKTEGISSNNIYIFNNDIYRRIREELVIDNTLSANIRDIERVENEIKNGLHEINKKLGRLDPVITLSLQNSDMIGYIYEKIEKGVNIQVRQNNIQCIYTASTVLLPCISVVIPVYNCEKYIESALCSVIQQTLFEIEIICVDDGSTDNSLSILKKYAEEDGRISIYHQDNRGQSAARNIGISKAKGEYIYFMDGDDLIDITALSTLYKYSMQRGLDVLYFDGETFYDDSYIPLENEFYFSLYKRNNHYDEVYLGEDLLTLFINNGEFLASPCLQLIRRRFLISQSIDFVEGIIHEDNIFSARVILEAGRAGYLPVPLFRRRIRKASTVTKSVSHENVIGYFMCFIKLLELVRSLSINEKNQVTVSKLGRHYLNMAREKYSELNEDEKKECLNLPYYYSLIFEELVAK
ncbi:glycosyltransferase family 2 protein [Butyrivibrio sp. XPD2002]|uniref:glycosyltransferase family 2 protein n=1 Tax=Butyrivibrio sp. XPD2002 TaxID=1280665 RepID=UPI0003F916ED|nr:glycosyltransferase [Butyrivibrio sp. XPD2002]